MAPKRCLALLLASLPALAGCAQAPQATVAARRAPAPRPAVSREAPQAKRPAPGTAAVKPRTVPPIPAAVPSPARPSPPLAATPPAPPPPAPQAPRPAAPAAGAARSHKVGLLFPTEGPRSEFGLEALRGAELCLEDPESRRAVRLEAVTMEEGDGDPAAAVAALADREGVVALVGPLLSETARALLPAAARRSLPVISPTAAAGRLGEGSRVFFRTCLTMESFVAALAGRAVERRAAPSFALLAPAEAYGRALVSAFGPALEARGGRVVLVREYARGLPELASWAATLASELRRPPPAGGWGVDGVFLAGSADDAGLILPRLANLGLDPRGTLVVGTAALDTPRLPRLAGGYAEGVLLADAFFAGSALPEAAAFVRRYRERHGVDPGAAAAQACAAVQVLAEALSGGASTPSDALAALGALGPVDTALGPVRLLAGGGVERRPFFITVREGRLVEERPVSP